MFRKKVQGAGPSPSQEQAALAETVLNSITDGVVIVDQNGLVKMMNPAAAHMTGNNSPTDGLGLSYLSIIRLENGEGLVIQDSQNPLAMAVVNNQAWESRDYYLVTLQDNRTPIAISMTPSGGRNADRIITFRNISQELEKEGEQTEFISTASHEMRTPVASIEGYLGLALNPQTATIDDRARQYLTEAHNASQHLGKLFRDLLDVTKLDDRRVKLHLVPVELLSTVNSIAMEQLRSANNKDLKYAFGSAGGQAAEGIPQIDQPVYAMVDIDSLREIINNLIENAVKYTEAGGSIWVNVRADGDNALINVTDSGIGISPDNLTHIFQKFYRADNSATRTVGGTGLGLYIVKQRVEAMGGKVWAQSSFGEGSTFYVSLPRIPEAEYERQKQIIENLQAMPIGDTMQTNSNIGGAALNAIAQQPAEAAAPAAAATPAVAPAPAPAATPTPAATTTPATAAPAPASAAALTPAAVPAPAPASSQNNTSVIQ